ncbi:MAG: DUF6265 family protein [Thermoanaerobaculia bacterium]
MMEMPKRMVLSTLVLACSVAAARDMATPSAPSPMMSPDQKPYVTGLSKAAWLAGHWVGPALGGEAEQIWSPPKADSMMGMFRLVRNGTVVFYELQTLTEEGGSLVLRLRHFNGDLTAWEERKKTVEFRLVDVAEGIIRFEGLSFRHEGAGKLTVHLTIEEKDGTVREEVFRYQRARPGRQ